MSELAQRLHVCSVLTIFPTSSVVPGSTEQAAYWVLDEAQ